MNKSSLGQIVELLRSAKRVGISAHVRPDGDAYGSTLALALWLKSLGKEVHAWNDEGMLEKFRYLPGSELVTRPPEEKIELDMFVAVDTSTRERLGVCEKYLSEASETVNIDHHCSNAGYARHNFIDDDAPATGAIIYDLLCEAGAEMTKDIATNLFVAISTDTGSFQYPSTTARTFEIGAALARAGVDIGRISQQMYETHPRRRFELMREVLGGARFVANGHVAVITLSREMAKRIGALPEDNEGLIDYIRAIEGVVAAVFLEELEDGKVRVSLRSKDARVDVCKVCQSFGGGGHALAAGARVKGSLAEVENRVLEILCHEVERNY